MRKGMFAVPRPTVGRALPRRRVDGSVMPMRQAVTVDLPHRIAGDRRRKVRKAAQGQLTETIHLISGWARIHTVRLSKEYMVGYRI